MLIKSKNWKRSKKKNFVLLKSLLPLSLCRLKLTQVVLVSLNQKYL